VQDASAPTTALTNTVVLIISCSPWTKNLRRKPAKSWSTHLRATPNIGEDDPVWPTARQTVDYHASWRYAHDVRTTKAGVTGGIKGVIRVAGRTWNAFTSHAIVVSVTISIAVVDIHSAGSDAQF
jgi:hypothetical protein